MTNAALSLPASAPRRLSEDWLSVIVGLGVLILALASLAGPDLLGWAVTTSVWNDPGQGARHGFQDLRRSRRPRRARSTTYVALLVVLGLGAAALGADVKRFAIAFTVVFVFAYASWFIGSWAYLATVTPADQAKFGVELVASADQRGRLHRRADRRA